MTTTQKVIDQNEFGKRLNSLIKSRRLSRIKLANAIGVQRQTIDNYVNGKSRPDSALLQAIADYFEVSTDDLLGKKAVTKDSETSLALKCSEYTGLSMDAVRVLHFWNIGKQIEIDTDNKEILKRTAVEESKDWLKLLSLIICTDDGGPYADKNGYFLISSLYEYVIFNAEENFTLFKANKAEEGYNPEVMGVFKSNDLLIADRHGFRPITTELMREAIRKYINDNMDKLAELIQGSPIKR